MKKKVKEIVIIVLGWSMLVLGIAGLFLPVIQGVLFILIGLVLLSKKSRWARSLLNRLKLKYPRLYKRMREIKRRANVHIGRLLKRC